MLMSLSIHLRGCISTRDTCDTITQWTEDWSSASVVTDPTLRQPSFDLPRHIGRANFMIHEYQYSRALNHDVQYIG